MDCLIVAPAAIEASLLARRLGRWGAKLLDQPRVDLLLHFLDLLALDGMRHWPFRSEDAAMFYPRIVAFERASRSSPKDAGSSPG